MKLCVALFTAALAFAAAPVSMSFAAGIDSDAGSTGFAFLKAENDARSAAMGRASVAASGAQSLVASNPAALSGLDGVQASASHSALFSTIHQNSLGVAWPQWNGTLGLAIRTQSSGDIPYRAADADSPWGGVPSESPAGTYGVYDASLSLAYAREAHGIHWGASVAALYEKIHVHSATAFAVDAGAQWRRDGLAVGVALRNLGRSGEMDVERVPLPWDARLGAEYGRGYGDFHARVAADVRYAPDYAETAHAGAEIVFRDVLALRAGYRHGLYESASDDGFSAGAGLQFGRLMVNYAYVPGPDGLDDRHVVAVSFGSVMRPTRMGPAAHRD